MLHVLRGNVLVFFFHAEFSCHSVTCAIPLHKIQLSLTVMAEEREEGQALFLCEPQGEGCEAHREGAAEDRTVLGLSTGPCVALSGTVCVNYPKACTSLKD